MFILGVILFALGILFSVAWHECGHMWMAQLTGMKVRRYFVGFGPTIWSRKSKSSGTEYGLKAIPLGGFCDIAGMTSEDKLAEDEKSQAMYLQKIWKRILVLLAGPLQNIILGIILVYILAIGWGLPNPNQQPQISIYNLSCFSSQKIVTPAHSQQCLSTSPAAKAGLLPGDIILEINGQPVTDLADTAKLISESYSNSKFLISRAGKKLLLTVNPQRVKQVGRIGDKQGSPAYTSKIGVSLVAKYSPPVKAGYLSGVKDTFTYTGYIFKSTWDGLVSLPAKIPDLLHALTGAPRGQDTPMSVYGASVVGGEVMQHGYLDVFLMLLASMNFFLGVFNLVPLLPFDGGHIAIAIYEKIRNKLYKWRGKNIPQGVEYSKLLPVTYFVFIILLAYVLLTFSVDIINPIKLF